MVDNKKQEDIVKEAVEEAKAKAKANEKLETNADECEANINENENEESERETEELEEDLEESDDNAEENDIEDSEEGKVEKESKKSLFGKKKKDKKDEKIEELTDRLMRQMAEFDNFRKRSGKEKSQMYEIGAKDIIEKLLPVVDNFERGLEAIPEEEKDHPFMEGMDKVYKHLMTTLETVGVKPIEAKGQPFDPDFHNAVLHVEDEEQGENTVVEELQKGYMYKDSVVRHSMVKVAN